MKSSRETIFTAVYNQLIITPGLVTTSRRLVPLSSLTADQCPALFTVQGKEDPLFAPSKGFGLPYSWHANLHVLLYQASNADPTFIPISTINPILDSIEALFPRSFTPGPGGSRLSLGTNTLGIPGVQNIQIEEIDTDEGLIGSNSAFAIRLGIYAL